jgi:hypothetical protein
MRAVIASVMTFWATTIYLLIPPSSSSGLMIIRVLGIGWGLLAISDIFQILAHSRKAKR